jgi:hypothetical protein
VSFERYFDMVLLQFEKSSLIFSVQLIAVVVVVDKTVVAVVVEFE